MIQLYYTPLSINSRRVWVTLLEKGLDFSLEEVNLSGEQFKPDFLALNPFHHIPVLVDGEKTIIESFAIMDYLEAKFPAPSLVPTSADALATVRMVQMVCLNELIPATRPMTMKVLFGREDPEAMTQAYQQVEVILKFLAQQLGNQPFFAGDQLTLADITAGTLAAWFPEMEINLDNYPTLIDWRNRLTSREAWQKSQPAPGTLEAFRERIRQRS
jgi:glutathione S-transferase